MIAFILFFMCYAICRSDVETRLFDGVDGYDNKFFDYHTARLLEMLFLFLAIMSLSGNLIFTIGVWLVADFVFERSYNLRFGRWISPHPFTIGKYTLPRLWYFPIIELTVGLVILWLSKMIL